MGVAITPNCKERAYWINREREELGSSDQKYYNYHALLMAIMLLISGIVA